MPNPQAKRLVIIVSDGLRQDVAYKNFDNGVLTNMPGLLRRTRRPDAVCRTSMADAPTESRPSHVALLAGFPEDLSNLLNGWKRNGQEFDHLLKRARHAFAFGGPDVVEFFDGPNVRIKGFPYERYRTDPDPSTLDLWALNEFRSLINGEEAKERIEGDGVVFFVHLAGVDTNGHRHGALSPNYNESAQYTDSVISAIETATEKRFKDSQTLFIFTADHGFPNVGGHGGADINSRSCPFVAWGIPALQGVKPGCQLQIQQKSISSFASALLGLSFPANSRVSVPEELMTVSKEEKGKMFISKAGQLLNEYSAYLATLHGRPSMWYDLITLQSVANSYSNRLKVLVKQTDGNIIEKAKSLISDICRSRSRAVLLRAFLTGFPFVLGCMGLVFFNRKRKVASLAINKTSTPAAIVVASIISAFSAAGWWFFAFRSLPSLISSFIATFIWIMAFPALQFGELYSLFMQSGITAAFLWTLWMLPLLSGLIVVQKNATKALGYKRLALGVALSIATLTKYESLRHIVAVVGIFSCAYGITDMLSGLERTIARVLSIELGILLKVLLVSRIIWPAVAAPLALFGYAIILGTVAVACSLLQRRGNLAAMSSVLGASLALATLILMVDPVLIFSMCAVLAYTATLVWDSTLVYETIGSGVEKPRFPLLLLLIILTIGPGGLSFVTSNDQYSPGPLITVLGLPQQSQVVFTAITGILLFVTLIKRIHQSRAVDISESLMELAMAISGPTTAVMMACLPYTESWLEIGTGIGKIYFAALFPLIPCICSVLLVTIFKNK